MPDLRSSASTIALDHRNDIESSIEASDPRPDQLQIPATLRPHQIRNVYGSCFTEQRLARMRLEGTGPPFVRAGRSVLYIRKDFDAWLESLRRRSTSDLGAGNEGCVSQ